MAYAVIGDIQAEFKGVQFSATSAPTSDNVTGFITQASALIDSIIGVRYAVPVTASGSLDVLKQICIELVTGRLNKILPVKTQSKETSQETQDAETKGAMDKLKMIAEGVIILSGATSVITDDGVHSGNVENGLQATFHRGVDQW